MPRPASDTKPARCGAPPPHRAWRSVSAPSVTTGRPAAGSVDRPWPARAQRCGTPCHPCRRRRADPKAPRGQNTRRRRANRTLDGLHCFKNRDCESTVLRAVTRGAASRRRHPRGLQARAAHRLPGCGPAARANRPRRTGIDTGGGPTPPPPLPHHQTSTAAVAPAPHAGASHFLRADKGASPRASTAPEASPCQARSAFQLLRAAAWIAAAPFHLIRSRSATPLSALALAAPLPGPALPPLPFLAAFFRRGASADRSSCAIRSATARCIRCR